MSCDVGEVTERLENELCSFSKLYDSLGSFVNISSWYFNLDLLIQINQSPSVRQTTTFVASNLWILQSTESSKYYTRIQTAVARGLGLPTGRQSSFSKLSVTSPTSQLILILQAFRHFTYVTAHSPTFPSLYLRHNSFSNPSVASPTSQLILQPFFRFSYVTGFSLTSPGEPPMVIGARNEWFL